MIDPALSVAFAVHSNPGAYALLLGSGVSRAAAVPTGWEIVKDLLLKLAKMKGADISADLFAWYKSTFSAEADYSRLLDDLTASPTERRQLLSGYFEQTEDEREQHLKEPTTAHRAIASLMRSGHVRIVLTTNFDRLLERAMDEIGVAATVISSADGIEGMPALAHVKNCIVKLHGDYSDTRIKNTVPELTTYDPRTDQLLERVFDEFGLIVCGWSGEWDVALRAAIQRCKTKRYGFFWASRGAPAATALRLVAARGGSVAHTADADAFFTDLLNKVESLDEVNAPHPLSRPIAVATMKRFLPDDKNLIRLADLLQTEVENVVAATSQPPLNTYAGSVTNDEFRQRVKLYDSACETLAAMMANAGYWGRSSQTRIWTGCIERFSQPQQIGGNTALLNLRKYPGLLCIQSFSVGAVANERYDNVAAILSAKGQTNGQVETAIMSTSAWGVFDNDLDKLLFAPSDQKRYPVSNHMRSALHPLMMNLIPDGARYLEMFDRAEYLLALITADQCHPLFGHYSAPLGEFALRRAHGQVAILDEELTALGDNHPYIRTGIFSSRQRLLDVRNGFLERMRLR